MRIKTLITLLLIMSTLISCSSPEPVFKDGFVTVQPSSSEAISYALKSGYGLQFGIGIILLVVAGILVYRMATDKTKKGGIAYYLVLLAMGAAAFGFIIMKPANIQSNNMKVLTEDQFYHYLQKDGDLRAVWDSCYKNNLLLSAPND